MNAVTSVLDEYIIKLYDMEFSVKIVVYEDEPVPVYQTSVINVSEATKVMLGKIMEEFVSEKFEELLKFESEDPTAIQARFKTVIRQKLQKYFPTMDQKTMIPLVNYVLQQNIGLGNIEILLKDGALEEIVVNSSNEPVWVYHRKLGWLKTNIIISPESKIRQYATAIGRDTGKEITLLRPFMDAHLMTGDRVNATLTPISTRGNTITIRKFAVKPWTVTDLIKGGTISYEGAAMLWLAVQNEMSILLSGGTASGKTSMLNGIANFFPPNQRIISIEDTRELVLPNILHWVPMETRLANPEAEVLFEAMHTGHSVYGTLHANNATETVNRLTSPPINMPKQVLSALGLIVVQHLNRKISKRRTLQIAEALPNGDSRVIMQYNPIADTLKYVNTPTTFFENIELYTGMTKQNIIEDLAKKISILKLMVSNNITDIHQIGVLMSKYYRGKSIKELI